VYRYWYTDGIAELTSGGVFLLLGFYFGIQGFYGGKSLVSVVLQAGLVVLMIAAFVGIRWLVNTLKMRLTYPRTGYVKYQESDRNSRTRRWVLVAVGLSIAVASTVLIDYLRNLDSLVLVTGFLVGLIFILLRWRSSGLKRFFALGALAILLGTLLSLSGLSQTLNLALFYGLLGLTIIASGMVVLLRYLADNPLPSGSENG
jgi:hypothetical protein